jgi:hypothetical protein
MGRRRRRTLSALTLAVWIELALAHRPTCCSLRSRSVFRLYRVRVRPGVFVQGAARRVVASRRLFED